MDLLQGYGSDDSSSSSSVADSSTIGPKVGPAAAGATQSKKRPPSILKKSSAPSARAKTTGNNTILSKKKGTRILKLNSVLPPEILERLTRSSVQNASGSRYSTSDEDSDDSGGGGDNDEGPSKNNNNNSNSQAKPTKQKRNAKSKNSYLKKQHKEEVHQNVGNDLGLNSLLSDLQTVIPTEEDAKNKNKKGKIVSQKSPGTGSNVNKNEKMGFAFMNVSSTVVHKKSEKAVVDIHASKKQVTVEDVSSEEDGSDDEEDGHQNDSKNAIPMFSSASSQQPANNEQKSSQGHSRSNTTFKRPRHTITAAPTIPTNFQTVKIVNQPQSSASSVAHGNKYQQQEIRTTESVMQPARKMSKREREKALRMGNFDVIDSSYITQNIDSSNYAAPNESDLLATASTSNPNASSYNTSNLQMYVPSEGTSVASNDVNSKQRSKHQIHSLVANARKLEADRARLGAMGIGKGKSTRTDAKRKYGW